MFGSVDIGGTKIAVAAVDADFRITARRQFPTNRNAGFDRSIANLTDVLQECEAEAGSKFEAIGIGCTGPVDPATGLVGAVDLLSGWEGAPLVELVRNSFRVPVFLENDADVAALGEWRLTRDPQFLFVSVGTGIGAGLILDGRIYRGVDGSHPELGHQTIDSTGAACYCGSTGCWESLASGPAIAKWYQNHTGSSELAAAAEIFERARRGESAANRAVERAAHYLGVGIANLVTIFCPSRIVLGGGVMQSADLLLEGIQGAIRQRCGLVPAHSIAVDVSRLGADAVLIGAAQLAMAGK